MQGSQDLKADAFGVLVFSHENSGPMLIFLGSGVAKLRATAIPKEACSPLHLPVVFDALDHRNVPKEPRLLPINVARVRMAREIAGSTQKIIVRRGNMTTASGIVQYISTLSAATQGLTYLVIGIIEKAKGNLGTQLAH